MGEPSAGVPPAGEVYDWYRRAVELLESGNAEAAAQLLQHARAHEPGSASITEAIARAMFGARRYVEAEDAFRELLDANPDDDYARFGLGLTLSRRGEFGSAAEHLALAVAMRPDRPAYADALRQVRATLRARAAAEAGTPYPHRPADPPHPHAEAADDADGSSR